MDFDMINPFPVWRRFFRETIWQSNPPGRIIPWCLYKPANPDSRLEGSLFQRGAIADFGVGVCQCSGDYSNVGSPVRDL